MKKVTVIGGGFAGLSAAALIAKKGHQVELLEKNDQLGGRARQFKAEGFTFDMGPSWYWMPDVFERYFGYFDKQAADFYDLKLLDPAFRVFFDSEVVNIPGHLSGVRDVFETYEKDGAKKLDKFFKEAKFKYDVGVHDIIYRQPNGLKPFLDWKIITSAMRLQMFKSIHAHIRNYFKHPILQQLLEFPVLFLGADPKNTPALYSLMSYAGYALGTWYPMGGMHKIIEGFAQIAKDQGVSFHTNQEVDSVSPKKGHLSFQVKGHQHHCDAMVAACDYHHFDTQMVDKPYQQYRPSYWDSRAMAPTSLLFYLGHKGKIDHLAHHNLFFDADFDVHSQAIYDTKSWPENPLFYLCCPSKTDPSVAPEGHENLFVLIPLAAGIADTPERKEHYFNLVADRILHRVGIDIRTNLVYRRDYATANFESDYHAFKGNAYGLANTLRQTAFLKPSMKHKKIDNLFFSGQLTVPGPGMPPSIVSGELAANYVLDYLAN